MAPRAYNSDTRRQQQAELKARIAAAAAQLHAEKGAIATSYADIAQRAGVSLPTVYNHFPTLDELVGACTGHVASQAPEVPVADILGATSFEAGTLALVEAIERIHLHFEPWKAWGEEGLIPALRQMLDGERRQVAGLIEHLLSTHLGEGDHRETAAVWESLLSFAFWHRLVREHKVSRPAARSRIVRLLLAAAGPAPAATTTPRPAKRK
jgi:AcrR family transcriptional regulator